MRMAKRTRTLLVALVCAAIVIAVLTVGAWRNHKSGPEVAREELSLALGAYDAGYMSAARLHATRATQADPSWGLAHAVLARTDLEQDLGDAAEAELDRARASGFDGGRAHQLYAQAFLQQDQPDRAMAEAQKASPRYADYAQRIIARAQASKGDYGAARRTLGDLLDRSPRDAAAWTDLGRVSLDAGDMAGAIDAATRAVALDRRRAATLRLRGETVRAQYGLAAALPWFRAALARDPYDHDTLVEYAATQGELGHYGELLAATRRALEVRPGSGPALLLQAEMAARAGDFALAEQITQRLDSDTAQLPAAMLLGGAIDYANGRWQQAVTDWGALLGQQPTNVVVRRLLGAAMLRAGDPHGVLDVLGPIAQRADADSYTLALFGRALEATGDRLAAGRFLDRAATPVRGASVPFGADDGLATLAAAADDAPYDAAAAVGYVKGLIDAGNGGAALARAQTLARLSPGAPAAQLLAGDALVLQNRWNDAAAAYARAAGLRFDEPAALRLIDALDRSGHRPQAARTLALFLSQNPQSVAALRIAAQWQLADEDWDAAITSLESIRALIGNRDAVVLAQLAQAYGEDGDPDRAIVYARAAHRIVPANPLVADAYGWALFQANNARDAVPLLAQAVATAPREGGWRWHLAQAQAATGMRGPARENTALALAAPGFQDRDAAQALLASLA